MRRGRGQNCRKGNANAKSGFSHVPSRSGTAVRFLDNLRDQINAGARAGQETPAMAVPKFLLLCFPALMEGEASAGGHGQAGV
jgi:hypothetical protein